MDAAHRTARRNRSIAGWDRSGTECFGTIWPSGQQAIFAPNASDRQMLNAVSELGVLLLLFGMETDLALVRRVRRTALITSAAGIVIPFACGYVLGEMLPDRLASRLAGWLVGARHLTATVMDAGRAANGSGPTSSASQGVIEAAETAAHAVEAKEKPHATETKNKARDPIDAAAKGAKAERIPVRKLISILLLEAHDVKTDDACAEAILG